MEYLEFVKIMSLSYLILTDSGGIQEEAPSLDVPVLLMRENTERPEAVESGCVRIVGTEASSIFKHAKQLIEDSNLHEHMARSKNPFGDGQASKRIRNVLTEQFEGGII